MHFQGASVWSEHSDSPESSGEERGGEGNGRGSSKGKNIDSKMKEEIFVSIFSGC